MGREREPSQEPNEFSAVLQACHAHKGSAVLLRTMLAEATRAGRVSEAVAFLAGLAPEDIGDHALRQHIGTFLTEAGDAAAAMRWSAAPRVVNLDERRAGLGAQPEAAHSRERAPGFADIGGLEEAKRQISRRIIAPRQKPGLFERFGRRAGGGLLLYGPPGCGKTMLAHAAAVEAKVAFIEVAIAEVLDRWLGESEKRITAAFAEAKARRPAILFFDEIEALAARRHFDGSHGMSSVVSAFLSAFDGLNAANEGVLVLAATNLPWAVDPAFRRPGRFDRTIFIPPPDRAARLAILVGLLRGRPVLEGVDLAAFAEATVGFSGADLTNLVETAIDLAIEQNLSGTEAPALTRRHLEAALKEVKPTTGEWLATARNYAKFAPEPGLYGDLLSFLERHGR
ncbi:26S protease regulatory subunit [Acidocella sp.]|uniref:ATP-binding protein n=1 Tax=Acidocella sp. TaxID=50710 RepID=UPI002610DCC3|nr:ATP-binding protein [Acidocella sp.]